MKKEVYEETLRLIDSRVAYLLREIQIATSKPLVIRTPLQPPLIVDSSTVVRNLNAERLGGLTIDQVLAKIDELDQRYVFKAGDTITGPINIIPTSSSDIALTIQDVAPRTVDFLQLKHPEGYPYYGAVKTRITKDGFIEIPGVMTLWPTGGTGTAAEIRAAPEMQSGLWFVSWTGSISFNPNLLGGGYGFSFAAAEGGGRSRAAFVYGINSGYVDVGSAFWIRGGSGLKTHIGADNVDSYLTVDLDGKLGIGTEEPTALLDVVSDVLRLRTPKTPSSPSDAGNRGDICWDENYIYVCIAPDTWRRAALSTW